MATQNKCWWSCNGCGHWVWRGVVTGPDRPCPRCGLGGMVPSGGTHFRVAKELLARRAATPTEETANDRA
jgi:hypothetical protein